MRGDMKPPKRFALAGDTDTDKLSRATLPSSRRQERRRALIICSLSLVIVALGAAAVIAIGMSPSSPETGGTAPTSEVTPRNATIIDELSRRCQRFDNQTGRMTLAGPCGEPVLDSNGVPVPLGTIHRLDTISKSFFGR